MALKDMIRIRPQEFNPAKDNMDACIVPMLRYAAEEVMAFTPMHVKDTLFWKAADRIEQLEEELRVLKIMQ